MPTVAELLGNEIRFKDWQWRQVEQGTLTPADIEEPDDLAMATERIRCMPTQTLLRLINAGELPDWCARKVTRVTLLRLARAERTIRRELIQRFGATRCQGGASVYLDGRRWRFIDPPRRYGRGDVMPNGWGL